MEQEEKWNRFVMTGKVEDYLNYRHREDGKDAFVQAGAAGNSTGSAFDDSIVRKQETQQWER